MMDWNSLPVMNRVQHAMTNSARRILVERSKGIRICHLDGILSNADYPYVIDQGTCTIIEAQCENRLFRKKCSGGSC